MVQRDGDEKQELRNYPHDSSPFNIIRGDAAREVHLVYDEQRKDIVRGGLQGSLSPYGRDNAKNVPGSYPPQKSSKLYRPTKQPRSQRNGHVWDPHSQPPRCRWTH